jgi:hypothetical protein
VSALPWWKFHAIPVLSRRPMCELRNHAAACWIIWIEDSWSTSWSTVWRKRLKSQANEDGAPESPRAFGVFNTSRSFLWSLLFLFQRMCGSFCKELEPISCQLRATYDFLVISHLNAGDYEEALKLRPQKPPWNILKQVADGGCIAMSCNCIIISWTSGKYCV